MNRIIILFGVCGTLISVVFAATAPCAVRAGVGSLTISPKEGTERQQKLWASRGNVTQLQAILRTGLSEEPTRNEVDAISSAIVEGARDLQRPPWDDELYFMAGLFLQTRHDTRGALALTSVATRLDPSNGVYRGSLADLYADLGCWKSAAIHYLTAARISEKDDKPHVQDYSALAAQMLERAGSVSQAENAYEKALAQASAYSPETRLQSFPGKRGESPQQFRKRVMEKLLKIKHNLAQCRPTQSWLRKDMPWLTWKYSGYDRRTSQDFISKRESDILGGKVGGAAVLDALGTSYAGVGRNLESLIESLATVQLDKNYRLGWQHLGRAYLREGRFDEAQKAFSTAYKMGDRASYTMSTKSQESRARYLRRKS